MKNQVRSDKRTKKAIDDDRLTLGNIVVLVFLAVMFGLFPLAVNVTAISDFPFFSLADGFVAIRHIKYYFFITVIALALFAELALLVTGTFSYGGAQKKVKLKKPFLKTLSFTDFAAAAFLLSCAISTLLSEYKELAFFGETTLGSSSTGRNNGLLLIMALVTMYFLLTRCFRCRETVLLVLAVSSSLVYLLTVLNGFYIDPLGMLEPFRYSTQKVFTQFFSTIGNKYMLSSFNCVTLPGSVCMAAQTEKAWRRAIYVVSSALGSMALIVGDSDSGMLGMAVFIIVFLAVYIRRPKMLKGYLLALCAMSAGILLLRGFSALMGDNIKELGQFSHALLYSNAVFFILPCLAAVTAAVYIVNRNGRELDVPKAVPVAILALLGASVLALLGAVLYFTLIDTKTDLGSMEKLLRLNDAWGTHRGVMWLRSFRIFGDAPFYRKLFGTGPDTFYFAFMPYFGELEQFGNSSTDAAHNEYLNYLITIGISGLGAYLALLGGALSRAVKARRERPMAMVFAAPVIAYAVQAVVNIAVPISLPLLFIFISLSEAEAKEYDKIREIDP